MKYKALYDEFWKFHKSEGLELVYYCPFCGGEKKKMYVNIANGMYHCKVCDSKGNAITLLKDLGYDGDDLVRVLTKYGIEQERKNIQRVESPKKNPKPVAKPISDSELSKFAEIKKLGVEELRKLQVARLAKKPHLIIPGYDPRDLDSPSAFIRCDMDGGLIQIANGSMKKYPLYKGSSPGLIGLKNALLSGDDTLVMCEGMKDVCVALSHGFTACSGTHGAGTMRESWVTEVFSKFRRLVICFDADDPGVRYANKLATMANTMLREGRAGKLTRIEVVSLDFGDISSERKDLWDAWQDGKDIEKLLNSGEEFVHVSEFDPFLCESVDPEHLAAQFEAWSIYKHRFNIIDQWSMYKDNKWQKIEEVDQLDIYVGRYLSKAYIMKHTKDGRTKKRVPRSNSLVSNVIKALKGLPSVYLNPSQSAPCDTSDSGRYAGKTIVAMQNGLLDVTDVDDLKLMPHDQDYYTFNYLPYDYVPDAKCPVWDNAVKDYFKGIDAMASVVGVKDEHHDTEAAHVLHQFIKRFLTGDTSHHKILCILGQRRSGKSTIARMIVNLIGAENVANITLSGLTNEYAVEGMLGKSLGIIWDSASTTGNSAKAVELLKNISGEDGLRVNRKYKSVVSIPKLNMSLMLIANEPPELTDKSGALAGRFSFMETTGSFFNNEDPTIEEKLRAELPGIFNKVIKTKTFGKIVEHSMSKEIREEYQEMTDSYFGFIRDYCELGKDKMVLVQILYTHYRRWCEVSGKAHIEKFQTFSSKLARTGLGIRKDKRPLLSESAFKEQVEDIGFYSADGETSRSFKVNRRSALFIGVCIKPEFWCNQFNAPEAEVMSDNATMDDVPF